MAGLNQLRILSPDLFQANRIAIVGNAGVWPEDQVLIEQSDLVIRFNNFNVREKIQHTHNPQRCDILFTTFDLATPKVQPKEVVIGIPFPFHQERIRKIAQAWYPNSNLWMVNPYLNAEMCEELQCGTNGTQHPFPSIGFTALWHLHQMGLDSKLTIFGFNWYADLIKETIQGMKMGMKTYPPHLNHTYPRELEWTIRKLTSKFSPSCMQVINMAKKQLK